MYLFKKTFLGLIFLILCQSCGGLLYHPTNYWYSDPKDFKLDYTEFRLKNADGFDLVGWHFKSKVQKGSLILFFHGNAQNITSHYQNFAWLPEHGHDFLIIDYRGYGISTGQPHQKGLQQDALAFLNYGHEIFKKGQYKKLVIYGQSLGGAVAFTALQSFQHKNDVNLLVLDSTFSSYSKIAKDKLQISWVTYLLSPLAYLLITDETAPWTVMKKHNTPTLVIHGTADYHVPYKFGEEFFNELPLEKNKNKWFLTIPNGEHIDVFGRDKGKYQKEFLKYL